MLTKLTLTIDKDVVSKAKSYAQKKHRSVSKLVEDYLMTISNTENSKSDNNIFIGTLTSSITGMFKEEYNGESYKELLENAIMEQNEERKNKIGPQGKIQFNEKDSFSLGEEYFGKFGSGDGTLSTSYKSKVKEMINAKHH